MSDHGATTERALINLTHLLTARDVTLPGILRLLHTPWINGRDWSKRSKLISKINGRDLFMLMMMMMIMMDHWWWWTTDDRPLMMKMMQRSKEVSAKKKRENGSVALEIWIFLFFYFLFPFSFFLSFLPCTSRVSHVLSLSFSFSFSFLLLPLFSPFL